MVLMKGFGPDTTRVIFELWAWLLVILLSALGVVGNLTLFKIGQEGQEAVASRFPRIDPARWGRAVELFETRGSWILLLSFLPGLGLLKARQTLKLLQPVRNRGGPEALSPDQAPQRDAARPSTSISRSG